MCYASGPYGLIYRCIFTMAFFGMFRLSNLVPPTASSFTVRENLCSADVWEHPPGLIIMSRWSKTRQRCGQTHFVGLSRLKNQTDLCPVRSHWQYRAIVPAGRPTVPMFRTPDGRVVMQAMVREAPPPPKVNVALYWAFPIPSDFSQFPERRCPALLLVRCWHCPYQSPWWMGVWLCVGLHCTGPSYAFPTRAPSAFLALNSLSEPPLIDYTCWT